MPKKSTTPSTTFPNKLVSVIDFAIPLIQTPSDPVTLIIPPLRPAIFPINCAIPPTMDLTTVTPILIMENIPSKVDFILSPYLSVHSLNAFDKSRIFSVILISCSDVAGGNTSRNAFLIGLMIFIKPSNAFLSASTAAARPPFSAHSPTTLFRASADFPIISLNVSETLVQSFLASSKSPTIYSQV